MRITIPLFRILGFFFHRFDQGYTGYEFCGFDVVNALDLPSGIVYPRLDAMTDCAYLERKWEDCDPRKVGRPRKCLYRISPYGREEFLRLQKLLTTE